MQSLRQPLRLQIYAATFWNLIWSPWKPLSDVETAKTENESKLVIDAKALYDLLIKEEAQAFTTSDKRTTIEVLVTQDKLACCKGKTIWVSSELQYADGLTKESAGQLLADRLWSDVTCLKTDETCQASKKKDAATRKRNTEMYAIKKPKGAMQALFAVTAGVCVCVVRSTTLKTARFRTRLTSISCPT